MVRHGDCRMSGKQCALRRGHGETPELQVAAAGQFGTEKSTLSGANLSIKIGKLSGSAVMLKSRGQTVHS